jgi:membrane-associated phospholipid phosphatase
MAVNQIETWLIVLGVLNLIMIVLSLIFFFPRNFFKVKINIIKQIKDNFIYLAIIVGVVCIHLFEVNLIDPITTNMVSHDFANNIQAIEGDFVYWFSQNWTPVLVYFFVLIYIGIYSFTLWFSPIYFLLTNSKKAMKTFAYGLLLIYAIALPFYLFLPITNVYTYYNVSSALESVIPTIESFFYTTTTQNNCLPSLHTAMTILLAYSVSLTGNKKLTYFSYFVMICVIISIIYLSIHWIMDVLTGALITIGVILILRRYMRGKV